MITVKSDIAVFMIIAGLLCVFFSCSSDDPEDQIKKLVVRAEKAAEEKNKSEFRDIISETYKDEKGRKRREVIGLLRYYFIQNKDVYVFSRIKDIQFPIETKAEVVVTAAIAGRPVNSPDDLKNINADLHRIEFVAEKESGEWKVTSASWSRASIEDFL